MVCLLFSLCDTLCILHQVAVFGFVIQKENEGILYVSKTADVFRANVCFLVICYVIINKTDRGLAIYNKFLLQNRNISKQRTSAVT